MKLYVLCSYGDGLNDPSVSTDYQELYKNGEKVNDVLKTNHNYGRRLPIS